MADVIDNDYWIDLQQGQSPIRPWDILKLGTTQLPGLWSLEVSGDLAYDITRIYTNQEAQAVGGQGPPQVITTAPKYQPRLTYRGYNPAKLTATGQIWEPEDWYDLKQPDGLPFIWPKKKITGMEFQEFDIGHPAAALLGVSRVAIVGVAQLPIVNQTLFVRIQMVEWFTKAPYYGRHSGGGPTISGPPPDGPDPQANLKP